MERKIECITGTNGEIKRVERDKTLISVSISLRVCKGVCLTLPRQEEDDSAIAGCWIKQTHSPGAVVTR